MNMCEWIYFVDGTIDCSCGYFHSADEDYIRCPSCNRKIVKFSATEGTAELMPKENNDD